MHNIPSIQGRFNSHIHLCATAILHYTIVSYTLYLYFSARCEGSCTNGGYKDRDCNCQCKGSPLTRCADDGTDSGEGGTDSGETGNGSDSGTDSGESGRSFIRPFFTQTPRHHVA